jgi:hypothetical protein
MWQILTGGISAADIRLGLWHTTGFDPSGSIERVAQNADRAGGEFQFFGFLLMAGNFRIDVLHSKELVVNHFEKGTQLFGAHLNGDVFQSHQSIIVSMQYARH